MKKVTIENLSDKTICLNVPELRLSRTWTKKGEKKALDFEILSEAIYYPGVEYFFEQKYLRVIEKEARVELGFEEKEQVEESFISEQQMKRYLTVLPLDEFKVKFKGLKEAEREALIAFAVAKEIVDYDKCEFIKKVMHKDIPKIIELQRAKKEG